MARARNRWGWGFEDAVIGAGEARAAAPGVVRALGFGVDRASRSRCPTPALPAPRVAVPRGPGAHLLGRGPRPRLPQPRQVLRRHGPRASAGATSTSSTSSRARATRREVRGRARVGRRRERRRHPLRRRHERRRRRRAAHPGPLRRRGVARPRRAGPGARGRRGLARGAHRRGRERPAPGGAARRPRADHALLPAVLRALDARAAGSRRARAGTSPPARRTSTTSSRPCARSRPSGDVGLAAAARLGRRALARPDAARLGGDPRRHHRGVGARAAAPGRTAPGATVRFASFLAGAEAVRAVVQAGLRPANCRLIDALEAAQTGAGDGERAVLVLGFESTDHDVEHELARALELCRAHGGEPDEPAAGARRRRRVARGVPAHALPARHARAPRRAGRHLRDRDHLGAAARLPRGGRRGDARGAGRALPRDLPLHARLSRRPGALLHRAGAGASRRRGRAVAGDEARRLRRDPRRAGGTITHHHAVGRDHRALVRRPAPRAVRGGAARRPRPPSTHTGVLNPGVLLDS